MMAAMKARDERRLSTLRVLKAELRRHEVDAGKPLDATAEMRVLKTMVQQRTEAAKAFRAAGRAEQAAKEEAEREVVETYLPPGTSAKARQAVTQAGFLGPIVGEQLHQVSFVMDYVRLHFNEACLTALTLPTVRVSDQVWTSAEAGWRDRLCERIGVAVESAYVRGGEIGIDFEDGARIAVSLKEQDYRGPEAINFMAPGGVWVVA